MTRPPFPKAIDSTLRGTFVACPRKFELQYLNHWKPQRESIHLVAGGAFAEGIEAVRRAHFERGMPETLAISEGIKAFTKHWGDFEPADASSPKSFTRMAAALVAYFDHHGVATDTITPHRTGGKYAIEFDFAIPISIDLRHPTTGDPILYTGRFDMLGDFMDAVWAVDEKTTSYLGKSWYNNWNLRSQLTGYVWAALESGYNCAGALIRGVAIRKTGFDFAESIQYRPRWFIERWHAQLIRDVRRMIDCWESGYFDYNLDNACTDYGGCTFQEICTSQNPERWLSAHFVQRIWDPLSGTETKLQEEG